VYFFYGMHAMLNVVTGQPGDAQAVLIRAAEALGGCSANLSGPGRLAKGMRITLADNGTDLTGDTIFIEPRHGPNPRIVATKRIGVEYAGDWQHELLRFLDAGSSAVSGKPNRA
jgi:DNA-3-methyladenine glycosylase